MLCWVAKLFEPTLLQIWTPGPFWAGALVASSSKVGNWTVLASSASLVLLYRTYRMNVWCTGL